MYRVTSGQEPAPLMELSPEESEVATRFGMSPRGNLRISYLIYLLPSLVLAVIGGVRDDRVLLLVAYAEGS